MKVTGIIAEYNPFHQGHAYHLSRARELTGADRVLVVMGGNFMQRGEPAIIDKYTRTEMALRNGADLVLELPAASATGSAEYFAEGAVELLDASGVVNELCFGSELGELEPLEKAAELLLEEPEDYQELLRAELKKGKTFPEARETALSAFLPEQSLLASPNNILAIEYIKALKRRKSSIRKLPRRRWTAGWRSAYGFRKPSRELCLCQHNPMPAPYSGKTDRNVMRTARFRFSYDSSGKRTSTFLFRTFKRCPAGRSFGTGRGFFSSSPLPTHAGKGASGILRLSGCFRRAFQADLFPPSGICRLECFSGSGPYQTIHQKPRFQSSPSHSSGYPSGRSASAHTPQGSRFSPGSL